MMKFPSFDRRLLLGGLSCIGAFALIWLYPFLVLGTILVALAVYFAYKHKLKLHPSDAILTLNHAQSKTRFRRRNYSQSPSFTCDTFKETSDLISTATSFGVIWNQNPKSELKARRSVRPLPGSQYEFNDNNTKPKDGGWNLGKSRHSLSRGSPGCGFASQVVSTAFHHYPVHQPHYGTLGLFPTINLQKSPLPLLSDKNSSMVSSPVTIKIAPPDAVKTPKSRIDFLFNNTIKKSPATDSVVAALQSCRKRTFKTINEEEEGVFKRQRRDSSASNGSAFMTPPSSNIYNGMIRTSNTLSPQPGKLCHHPLPILKNSNGNNAPSRKFKNNEIYSSYSSSKAFWKRQTQKSQSQKRKIARCSSPAIKVSKLHSSENPGEISGRLSSSKSDESTSSDHLADSKDADLSVQATGDTYSISPKSPTNTSGLPWKKGYSLKHQLPLYSSLAVSNKSPSSHVTLSNATLEDDDKDKQANEARLQKLLAGVNKAFQNKEEFMKQNNRESMENEIMPIASQPQIENPKSLPAFSTAASSLSSSVGTTSAEAPSSAASTSTSNLLISSQPLLSFINSKISNVEGRVPSSNLVTSSASVLSVPLTNQTTDAGFQLIPGNCSQNSTAVTTSSNEPPKLTIVSLPSKVEVNESNNAFSINTTTSSTQPSFNLSTANTVSVASAVVDTAASKPSTSFFPAFSTGLSVPVSSATVASAVNTAVPNATVTASQLFSPFSPAKVSPFDNSCSFAVKDAFIKKDANPFNSASVSLTTNSFAGKLEQNSPAPTGTLLGRNMTETSTVSVSKSTVQTKPVGNSTTATTPFSFGPPTTNFNFGNSTTTMPNFSFGSHSAPKVSEQKQPTSETISLFNFSSSNSSGNQASIFKNTSNEPNHVKFPANGPVNPSVSTNSSISQSVSAAPVFLFGQSNNTAFGSSSPFTFSAVPNSQSQVSDSQPQNPFSVTSPASTGFSFNSPTVNFSSGRKPVQARRRSNRS